MAISPSPSLSKRRTREKVLQSCLSALRAHNHFDHLPILCFPFTVLYLCFTGVYTPSTYEYQCCFGGPAH
ncbi:hypothetical protein F5146DRAFT_1222411 [Armillaria mellea]|nr:hypothetical protein F5146DRAFT_1222411 [Armillaria mellea]